MNVCFIVASMDKRIGFLERCIKCFAESKYAEYDIYCYFQGHLWDSVQGREIFKEVVIDPNPRGVFTPRYELMKRYGKDYDYVIIIDDDLFIQPETDYFGMIDFMRKFRNVGAMCCLNVKAHIKNRVDIVGQNDCFNVLGGMVFSRAAIQTILDYFADKEKDYTFDCVWLLLWIKGYDLAKDFRSFAVHKTAGTQKIDGEWTGFNWSRFKMNYVPFMPEYLNEPKQEYNPKRYGWERGIPSLKDVNEKGLEERGKCRKDS